MQQMARSAPIRATNWGRLGQVTAQACAHFTFQNYLSFCSFLSPSTQTQTTPALSGSFQTPATSNRPHSPTYFMVREGFTPLLHKAVQERERDEAEEDDKENSTADHSLGLWAVAQQQREGAEGEERGRGHSLVRAHQCGPI